MRGLVATALLFISALAAMRPACAVPVTYDFDGSITITSAGASFPNDVFAEAARLRALLPGSLSSGNALFFRPLSGSLTVDSDAMDLEPDPRFGSYEGFGLLSAFSVSFEGFNFSLDPARPNDSASVTIFDDSRFDLLQVTAALSAGLLPGPASELQTQLGLNFFSFEALDLISSDRFPDLTLLKDIGVTLDFIDRANGSSVGYGARISSLTRRVNVPETGTALLFCLGMLSLLYSRRRGIDLRCGVARSAYVHYDSAPVPSQSVPAARRSQVTSSPADAKLYLDHFFQSPRLQHASGSLCER